MSETIKSYKGFDKSLKCRDFQYEIGKEYEHDGPVEACKSGFHACEAPLDVFAYYAPATSRYCEVEQSGELSRGGDDSKIASSKIKIGAEIGIPGLVKAQIEWVKSKTHEEGAASATGKESAAMASGKDGRVMGARGSAMFLVERGEWIGDTYPILNVAAFVIDGDKYKPGTWYTLKNGVVVEVAE